MKILLIDIASHFIWYLDYEEEYKVIDIMSQCFIFTSFLYLSLVLFLYAEFKISIVLIVLIFCVKLGVEFISWLSMLNYILL